MNESCRIFLARIASFRSFGASYFLVDLWAQGSFRERREHCIMRVLCVAKLAMQATERAASVGIFHLVIF
ncbi:MAG: hypothetical protein ACI8Z1_003449 [Candidatus Azotimanducaceae bacterium]